MSLWIKSSLISDACYRSVFLSADVRDTIYIEWINLGSSRAYETSELKEILGETEKVTNKSSCQHK